MFIKFCSFRIYCPFINICLFNIYCPVDYTHSSTKRYLYDYYELMRKSLKEIDWKLQFKSCNVYEM